MLYEVITSLSIEMAASWPCTTAQMMFFGPKAESPPKKTCFALDWKVTLSRTGRPHLSNSMPASFSIHGKAFSGGVNVNDLAGATHVTARETIMRLHRCITAARECPVPVIARVNGYCIGGALELAAACDLRIASSYNFV